MPDRSKMSYVRATVDNEGFHYAFLNYHDFHEVKDEKFHDLRKTYIEAARALQSYIGPLRESDYDE